MTDRSLLGTWVRRFLLEHLIGERNLPRNTQQSYRDMFCLLVPFVAGQCKKTVDRLLIEDVSAEQVREFLSQVEDQRQCSVSTRNQRLAAIHAFARFVGERNPESLPWCNQVRAVPFKRAGKNPLPYLDKPELDALLEAPDRRTKQGFRDHTILLFLYNSGARASEAVHVTVGDLEWDPSGAGSVKLRGKGGKVRFCPLWTRTMNELRPLIQGRGVAENLFLNRYGRPLTRFGVYSLVERHAASAAEKLHSIANKRVSPHTIRHTTATHLLRAGVDINTIRAWLGHVSIDTTNIYAEIDLENKAQALAACEPTDAPATKRRWRDDPDLMKFLRDL